mmetsp:Transcript_58454/g.123989  ORF Transcript_58454/g.123989 Transcript_58454/m.123989 type:complete len:398 (+) Transcript_58454:1331-2524(+)
MLLDLPFLLTVVAPSLLGVLMMVWLCCKKPPPSDFDVRAFLNADTDGRGFQEAKRGVAKRKTIVVVLNPVAGGQGKSEKLWLRAKSILDTFASDHSATLLRTCATGHARQWAFEELTTAVDIVLCIGGDGTSFEIVNGILSRPDAADIVENVALAIVPAGSGNGLSKSLGLGAQEVEKAVAVAIRGNTTALDIVKVIQGSATWYSFLFVAYGLIADCDIESEAYRLLGPLRFYIAAIVRILAKRRYRIRLQGFAHKEFKDLKDSGLEQDPARSVDSEFEITGFLACNCPWMTDEFLSAPKACINDGYFDVAVGLGSMTRWEMARMLLEAEIGRYVDFPSVQYFKTKQVRLEAVGGARPRYPFDDLRRMGTFDLDGEAFAADVPLDISMHTLQLRVCC